MAHWNDLSREYETRRYPPTRRLDVQGEGPETARQRVLRWIQSFAHEQPGADLLLVVERGRGARHGAVRLSIEKLLAELQGGLIEWWAPFGDGSLALRVSLDPRMQRIAERRIEPEGEGRTEETAGAAYVRPQDDIPPELLPLAGRAAELRRVREGLPVGVTEVIMRRLWIEAQAAAMTARTSWEDALRNIVQGEEARMFENDE